MSNENSTRELDDSGGSKKKYLASARVQISTHRDACIN
jgi:hypothetical protein